MNRRITMRQALCILVGFLFQCQPVSVLATEEQDPDAQHREKPGIIASSLGDQTLNVELLDLELLDQDGVQHKFASDVIAGKIVALDFIYTSCTTACPLISAIFAKLQKQLGYRLGQQVRLVTVSINPLTDSPARLKEYADRFHAGPDWIWLTGDKPQVERILKGLGVYTADFTRHPPTFLVGDASQGLWTRINGLPSPDEIVAKIDALLAARGVNTTRSKE